MVRQSFISRPALHRLPQAVTIKLPILRLPQLLTAADLSGLSIDRDQVQIEKLVQIRAQQ